ncbi:MAG: hypothetical protein ACTHNH_10360 [Mesorhizobium sp.]
MAIFGEVSAAAAMTVLLAPVAILGLLLAAAVLVVLVALLAGFHMLFVATALGHCSSPCFCRSSRFMRLVRTN